MSNWQPITEQELQELVLDQLTRCTPGQQRAFLNHRVPTYKVPIHRIGGVEQVFVVAQLPNGLVYFEDVEDGFDVGSLGSDGALSAASSNQRELCHVLAQAGF